MGRLSIEEQLRRYETAQQIAKSRGGKLLSKKYHGVDAKHKWSCHAGHEWETTYDCVVKRGQWCKKCCGRIYDRSVQLKRAREIAKDRKGKCLSGEYVSSQAQMRWRCAKNHEWEATFSNISKGKWCPWCAGNKVDPENQLKRAQAYALKQEGNCLTSIYQGNKVPMHWRCKEGHEWYASFSTVVNRGAWCGICRGSQRSKREQLALAKEVAESKGGKCLSPEYLDNSSKLRWRCNRGHEWEAVFYAVVQAGSWCPFCSVSLRERLTRHIFEQLFEVPFKKTKPSWLLNPETGRKLELDGFNAQLNLAFEYQGEQHYHPVLPFKMDANSFAKQQRRDTIKRKLCEQRGVACLEISHEIDPNDLPQWIAEAVSRLPDGPRLTSMMRDWRNIRIVEWLESDSYSINDLRRFAKSRGGLCMSKTYTGVFTKYAWQCKKGHHWSATWDSVNNASTWCPSCVGKKVDPAQRLALAKSVAASKGGKCLSDKYEDSHKKMRWRCAFGHEWEVRYYNVVNGVSWCPVCRERRSTEN